MSAKEIKRSINRNLHLGKGRYPYIWVRHEVYNRHYIPPDFILTCLGINLSYKLINLGMLPINSRQIYLFNLITAFD